MLYTTPIHSIYLSATEGAAFGHAVFQSFARNCNFDEIRTAELWRERAAIQRKVANVYVKRRLTEGGCGRPRHHGGFFPWGSHKQARSSKKIGSSEISVFLQVARSA